MSAGHTKAPCRGCQNRFVGCHSECERYQEFLKIHNEERDQIYKSRKDLYPQAPHYFMTEEQFRIAGNNNKMKVFKSKKR